MRLGSPAELQQPGRSAGSTADRRASDEQWRRKLRRSAGRLGALSGIGTGLHAGRRRSWPV